MKTILSYLLLVLTTSSSFSTSWTINNSGNTFSPSTITVVVGDDVTFSLESVHNAVEVSQATWNANGTAAVAGGFQVALEGGPVQAAQPGIGTHYYVCTPHTSPGMKGTIIVQNATGIEKSKLPAGFSIYPNPSLISLTFNANDDEIGSGFYIADLSGRRVACGKIENSITTIGISYLARDTCLIGTVDQRKRFIKLAKL
ncbi:MAG: plastocyanin/azurin family copper-binding protein [Bacteroidales bacterium]